MAYGTTSNPGAYSSTQIYPFRKGDLLVLRKSVALSQKKPKTFRLLDIVPVLHGTTYVLKCVQTGDEMNIPGAGLSIDMFRMVNGIQIFMSLL